MQQVEPDDKPSTSKALVIVPAQELTATTDTDPPAPRMASRAPSGIPLTAGKLSQRPTVGITGNGKQLPPLNTTKEGKIYKIRGSGLTRSLKRGRLVNEK